MKAFIEKMKGIYHILKDKEYAIYTITTEIKSGEIKRKSDCCIISDSASPLFLDTISQFTKEYSDKIKNYEED